MTIKNHADCEEDVRRAQSSMSGVYYSAMICPHGYTFQSSITDPQDQPLQGDHVMARHTHSHSHRRKYGLGSFLFDLFMICITAGLWIIWIFCREMRNR